MIIHLIVATLAILVTGYLLPGVTVGVGSAILAAIVLGFLNAFIKPLIVLFTLPVNVLTLGLFTLVINAVIIMLVSAIVPGFDIGGFWMALVFSIVLALVNVVIYSIVG